MLEHLLTIGGKIHPKTTITALRDEESLISHWRKTSLKLYSLKPMMPLDGSLSPLLALCGYINPVPLGGRDHARHVALLASMLVL